MAILNTKSAMNFNSLIEVDDYFKAVKKSGLSYAAITNDGTLNELFEISEAAKDTGVKPIVGCRFPFRIGENVIHLALYPRNNFAKKKLNSLSTKFHKNEKRNLGLEGKKNTLNEMAIVIDSQDADYKVIKGVIKTLSTFLEKNILFVGLHETFEQKNKEKNLEIKKILDKESIKYVPFNEIKYLNEEQFDTYNYLSRIKGLESSNDIDNILPTAMDIEQMFDYMEGTADGTLDLVSQIKANYIIKQEPIRMPSYDVPEDFVLPEKFKEQFAEYIKIASTNKVRSAGFLWQLVFEGLIRRYQMGNEPLVQEAVRRAKEELEILIEMNYSDYFLIVWDFMKYAYENGILTGPGRGSVAGSIVAYCLNITQACPIVYQLQFQRFLNRERKEGQGMPDIDIDVDSDDREKLIKYLRNKYGKEYVSHILTKSKYGFKDIKNNLLKIMRVPSERVDEMMNFSPDSYDSLEELIKNKPEVKDLMAKSKDIRVLLEQSYALKSLPENISTHAAGIIISSVSLEEGNLPMMYDSNGNLITQVFNDKEKNSLELQGELKLDILGLKNLSVIRGIRKRVEDKTGKPFPSIPLDDEKTLKLFAEAEYLKGIFQFESGLAQKVLKQIGIEIFDDIVLANALNRPGPSKFVPIYAQRKGQPIKMLSEKGAELQNVEDLYPTLESTSGIIVYQEQINELAVKWAGYSLGQAENFRRAISKKDEEALKKEGVIFIKEAVKFGRDEETTREIFNIILRFAEYGFNKSHAVVYSMISYELAYMKVNYPLEFWASLLTNVGSNTKQVSLYIEEARRMGINILPPDINQSTDEFQVEDNAIRCAFQMINSIGVKTAKAIVEARKNMPFKHLYDVIKRFKTVSSVDDGNLEVLSKVGALDSIGQRHEILAGLKPAIKENTKPLTKGEKAILELENCQVIFSISKAEIEKLTEAVSKNNRYIAGVITSLTPKKDRREREMASIEIISINGEHFRPVIFSNVWVKVKNDLSVGSIVLAEIKNGVRGNVVKINTIKL